MPPASGNHVSCSALIFPTKAFNGFQYENSFVRKKGHSKDKGNTLGRRGGSPGDSAEEKEVGWRIMDQVVGDAEGIGPLPFCKQRMEVPVVGIADLGSGSLIQGNCQDLT